MYHSIWKPMYQAQLNIIIKNTNFLTKRKCLFPYLNENKKVANEDKSKILIELDTYLCEEGREPNLLFTKKHLYPCLYKLALKYDQYRRHQLP